MAFLSAEELRDALDYNPETGVFARKGMRRVRHAQDSDRPGHLSSDGYRYIRVRSIRYLEHRLAWFYVYGRWPAELDHINRVRSDNRIGNLREATRSQNKANVALQSNNTSGVKGVLFDRANGKWMAYIQVDGKFKNLGRFELKEDAMAARVEAFRKTFGEFAHHG